MSRKFRSASHSGMYSVRGSELARTGNTNPQKIRCVVELLDDSEFIIDVDKNAKGTVLLNEVFRHLDIQEKHYFGLQYVSDSPDNMVGGAKEQWLQDDKIIRKQKKGTPPYIFYFCVRFFVSDPSKLVEDLTRYYFYLQIKRDILTGRLPCLYDTAAELSSYILQAELGDYDPKLHLDGYVSEFRFIPDQTDDFEERAAEFHKHHIGQTPADAEFNFLEVAKTLDLYGVDLHCAKDHDGTDLFLGVSALGLTVYHNKCKINFFPWSKIVKVCFKRKRFFIQIRPDWNEWTDNIIGFQMLTYRSCKNLWKVCVEYHSFYRTHYPKATEKRVLRMGSKYRYKGKTEYQAIEESRTHARPEPKIVRTLSRRYSKRSDSGTWSRSLRRLDLDREFEKDSMYGEKHAPPFHYASAPNSTEKLDRTNFKRSLSTSANVGATKSGLTPELQANGSTPQEGLITVRMEPDKEGRFGFNVQGGADINLPVIVSKIARGTPADLCMPQLQEGDEIIFINGQAMKGLIHQEIVDLIRSVSQSRSNTLILTIRPNVFAPNGSRSLDDSPVHTVSVEQYNAQELKHEKEVEAALVSKREKQQQRDCEGLKVSIEQLRENLESGDLLVYFQELYRKKPGMAMDDARKPENLPKNRYRDILPYDETRVKLFKGSDYINANFVNMEVPSRGIVLRYIAAQGPLEKTCGDFWQMIWEQESTLVIMLTTTMERGRVKCHQYWPEGEDTWTFGNLEVVCNKIRDFSPSYVYREMYVTDTTTLRSRVIIQLQYLAWPDHDVPDDATDFLEFVHSVRHYREGTSTPAVVHCSAGVGRSGVLMFIETAFGMIEGAEPVYPLELVRRMRDQRGSLIQTPGQFLFVCEATLKAYDDEVVRPLPIS
ncbi:tyrosine-protein phosphatase non-receptor type 4 isoform X1 [Nematostella vectensis]|uniref:tyrosine-protein phosphatase non-receptor type 4 isoform X1 n=1 Tax=Nematostella vectensis TaxID=45351 RepID=UPI00207795AA|nr:tyrosine-protein phosphatase non-receptor type 4 isoform X1 [Nematostella vectensis]